MKKKEICYYNENGEYVKERLMLMRRVRGEVSIEEADFHMLYTHIAEIYNWALLGKEINEGLMKIFESENALEDLVYIIRHAKTMESCCEDIISKYGVSKNTAEAIVNLKISEVTGIGLKNLQNAYDYYVLAIEQLRPLLVK